MKSTPSLPCAKTLTPHKRLDKHCCPWCLFWVFFSSPEISCEMLRRREKTKFQRPSHPFCFILCSVTLVHHLPLVPSHMTWRRHLRIHRALDYWPGPASRHLIRAFAAAVTKVISLPSEFWTSCQVTQRWSWKKRTHWDCAGTPRRQLLGPHGSLLPPVCAQKNKRSERGDAESAE